jgi:hypothetical protein
MSFALNVATVAATVTVAAPAVAAPAVIAALCKVCNGNLFTPQDCCEHCQKRQRALQLCRLCCFDRSCARCGAEIPYADGNFLNMTCCQTCIDGMKRA